MISKSVSPYGPYLHIVSFFDIFKECILFKWFTVIHESMKNKQIAGIS